MISTITDYIINRFDQDDLVNTITLSPINLVDTSKENIYPIVSIVFNNKTLDDDLLLFDYTIHVLQQRDVTRKVKSSKLSSEINWIDNLNECDSIVTEFVNYIRRMDLDNYNVESLSDLEVLQNYGGAGLDGFAFDIVISYPNIGFCPVVLDLRQVAIFQDGNFFLLQNGNNLVLVSDAPPVPVSGVFGFTFDQTFN
jgi:hypothetical protein